MLTLRPQSAVVLRLLRMLNLKLSRSVKLRRVSLRPVPQLRVSLHLRLSFEIRAGGGAVLIYCN